MAATQARRIWFHALGAKVGGGITYLKAVLPELVRQLDGLGVGLVVLVPRPLEGVALPAWVEVKIMPRAASGRLARLAYDQLILPLRLLHERDAVLYCTGSFAPLFKPVPTSVLVRNALYFDDAFLARELPRTRTERRLEGALIALGARGCAAVYYPSQSMRDLTEARHPRLAKIGVTNGYGVASAFLSEPREGRSSRREALGEGGPRFLYVMTYTLQKNLGLLLEALALARARGIRVSVVVTSGLRAGPRATYERDWAVIREHDLIGSGYLVPVGPTYGDDLVELYRSVDACVFPSFCESFGHPLVEAMALGKPIICADRPYARELCGAHAVYVDPDDPEALVDIWQRWPDPVRDLPGVARDALARRFSWSDHVARLLETLLSDRPPRRGECAPAP